ncbi:acyl carrier protein [Undibacterium arcticum]|uniref:Acyl carrier protein n=2 Tax=Undibacterium arcticum TaxID=1762892 RepID=A0ABV7F3H0_9BURK
MMNAVDVAIKIKYILHERFGIDTSAMDDSTKLSDLGIDSLHLAEIMLDIETELDITIEDLPLLPETTLGDLAAIVSNGLLKSA